MSSVASKNFRQTCRCPSPSFIKYWKVFDFLLRSFTLFLFTAPIFDKETSQSRRLCGPKFQKWVNTLARFSSEISPHLLKQSDPWQGLRRIFFFCYNGSIFFLVRLSFLLQFLSFFCLILFFNSTSRFSHNFILSDHHFPFFFCSCFLVNVHYLLHLSLPRSLNYTQFQTHSHYLRSHNMELLAFFLQNEH